MTKPTAHLPYSYELPDAERDHLTREFLATTPPHHSQRFVCFEIEGSDPFANIARQLEREVFFESWGNDAATMQREYGPYEESSVFFLAIDTEASAPAGVLRMIRNSPAGLKTIVDLDDCRKSPIAPIAIPVDAVQARHGIDDLDKCWDGATAAVPRRYRRKSPTIHMQVMLTVFAAAMRDDIQHFVAVLDAPVVKTARDLLGLPLVALAGTPPFTHMDAPDNQAVYAHIPSLLKVAADGNRRVGQKIRECARRSHSHAFQTLS
ncbi:hypothetical protein Mycch_0365 [Mycolicibacterium chubuense NBB4]|uniref:Uncharacterized protein n=1 Tax=Mycolicibacterium chubuense (strain NBB4) TaxID=710421 RepID=I4BD31_MYCCN|nr:hypothetical protein [Mycolicibacterium chubuense]AFM15188.1 hypothetical protein Mycch_0365 [Mycolicibacterium chubuense NBB4]